MSLPQDTANLQSKMNAAVREHWKAFLFEGVLLVVLGLAAIIVPPLASLAVTIFLGQPARSSNWQNVSRSSAGPPISTRL